MGTAAKIIGVEDSAISKISGVTLTSAAKIGGQTVSTFSNTYSMNFDGSNDIFSAGAFPSIDNVSKFSVSVWFKPTNFDVHHRLWGKYGTTAYWLGLDVTTGGRISGIVVNGGLAIRQGTDDQVTAGQWNHIVMVFDGTQGTAADRVKLYIDGDESDSYDYITGTFPTTTPLTSNVVGVYGDHLWIGSDGYYGLPPGQNIALGNIDEVGVWDEALDADAITVLHNSGTPTDLSVNSGNYDNSGDLKGWWRMGDNGSFKSTQWLIPNNANKDKFSNYSMDFDGTNDYIDCGNISALNGVTTATWTGWFNRDAAGSFYMMSTWGTTGAELQFTPLQTATSLNVYMANSDGAQKTMFTHTSLTFTAGTWYHLAFVYDEAEVSNADKMKVYINGVVQVNAAAGAALTTLNAATSDFEIGKLGGYATNEFNGNIDEVAIWDTALDANTITSIYNSGTPNDLTLAASYTAGSGVDKSGDLQGYWKMGEEATFDGSDWTIPDSSTNSNDGTSANMDIADRVGDAPNSASNAVSLNMVEADREEETP
tara:strand:+ start:500 stop:2116 length:1617 start_codon:yes stop_codon:yes gene_type:complete